MDHTHRARLVGGGWGPGGAPLSLASFFPSVPLDGIIPVLLRGDLMVPEEGVELFACFP
jgi:hypothetical protein